MFYQDYLWNRSLRESLENAFVQQQQLLNAAIIIRDLVVYYAKNFSYGESKENNNHYQNIDTLTRLIHQIQLFAVLANRYHQQAYCERDKNNHYQLKKEYLNTITRLSLNEFALYSTKPLSEAEFAYLMKAIEKIAASCHMNVHLLLSSLAIVNEKQEILNVTLYVECGTKAKIHTIVKGLASTSDIEYPSTQNFSQHDLSSLTTYISSCVSGGKGNKRSSVSNHSLLTCKTAGGAKFLVAVDVCVDHLNCHSKKLLLSQLESKSITNTEILPKQVDQIVVSNSVDIHKKAKITPLILHVDPRLKQARNHNIANKFLDNTLKINPNLLFKRLKNNYTELKCSQIIGGIKITKPPFGSDFFITVYKERQLGTYVPNIAEQVNNYNDKVIKQDWMI